MSAPPYFPFFPSDFLAGVGGLSATERGVYITVLCLIYERQGPIDIDTRRLARRCGCTANTLAKAIKALVEQGKLVNVGGGLTNERAESVIKNRTSLGNVQRDNANKRWEKSKEKQRPIDAAALPSQCQPDAYQNQNHIISSYEDIPAPSEEEPLKASSRGAKVTADLAKVESILEPWLLPSTVNAWLEHRSQKRIPMTSVAATRIAEQLEKIFHAGHDPNDAIGEAIERGWNTVKADWYFNCQQSGRANRSGAGGRGAGLAEAFANVARKHHPEADPGSYGVGYSPPDEPMP